MQLADLLLESVDSLCVHGFKPNELLVLGRKFSLKSLSYILLNAFDILD